jgi:hypothetical protein
MTRLRRNPTPYFALLLVLAIGVGGGYALAASNTKTITVCADKTTGVLHLKTRGRCKSSQTRVSWNQQGPPGPQGAQGPTGSQGPAGAAGPTGAQGRAAVNVWATVADNGTVLPGQGQGLTVQHLSPGTYQVTITDPTCAHENNAPVITVSDSNPPAGHADGFPVAWYGDNGPNEQFMVVTGVVSGTPLSFAASDHTFDIHDTCP